ncbi:YqjF family protein [Salinirubellus sp. GCM10025818]|uniref:YqjF family protein n=1 Tax=Salinirubellus TaxID=2162630 RepID=UPI0030CB703F
MSTGGSTRLPKRFQRGFPQLNFRTYVTMDDEPGVYFLSLDSGRRAPAAVGRRAFGLPFHHARMRMTRRGDEITFQSQRDGDHSSQAVFQARYRPTGEPYQAAPGTLEAHCVEHFRYYLPAPEDRRANVLRAFGSEQNEMYVGTIEREPWELRPATATIRRNTLFEAAGLPTPTMDPVIQFSPGFEMAVGPLDTRPASEDPSTLESM